MNPPYITPRDYILSGDYKSLNIQGIELSPLEKAIIGFVVISSADVRGRKYVKSAAYHQIHELVF